ncbi:integrase, catalytic region, zinc finger, CCHC-type containing protein [Tanacetum coccineum]
MLLCKQEEAGIQLSAKQVNWRNGTDYEPDTQELEAHYMYMAHIQEVTPDATDNSRLIFDAEPLQKVQNDDDNYNVFVNDREHHVQPISVNDTYLEEQGDTNIIIESSDMSTNGEMVDQDDDNLAKERDLLASLIEKLKCEINDIKNRNKFLESSNKTLIDKLKDLKKFQDELDRYHDVNYASKMEIDCTKAKGDFVSYKMESQKSLNEHTQKINDLNQTISEMKTELFAHQETISIMSQEKEAQKKFHKTREDKKLEKVIALENKINVLDDIVYKIGQSVQTMNMLNHNCKTSFVKPKFLKKAQRANPHLYDIGCYNDNLSLMLAPESDETILLNEIDRLSKEYYYADHMNAILGVYTTLDEYTDLQCEYVDQVEQIKNDKAFKENQSKVFLKEREQYFEIQDLKAQLQDKGIAISELKKLIEKMKGKSVETKFEKPSVIRQPNAFKSQRQSVLGKPATFLDSLAKTDFSKSKSVTTINVSNDFSKPVTTQILPQNVKSILKNTNVIAPGMYKVHTKPNQTRTPQLPQDIRKTNKRVSFSTGVISTTSVSRPQLKSNQLEDRVMHNNSQRKKQQVEDHHRNFRTKMPMVVPISIREPKRSMNQSAATPLKRTVAAESTNQKLRSTIRKQYEQISNTCKCMHLETKSRTTTISEPTTLRNSTISNTSPSSNSFAARMVKFGNDQIALILGYGDLVQGNITIKMVYYVEGLNHNLFYVVQFCYIRDLKGNDLLTGSRRTKLYSITLQETSTPNPICLMAKATSSEAWLWHHRLSHINFDTINLLSKYDIVTDLPKLKFIKDHLCSSCELRKAKRTKFLNKTLHAYFVQEGIEHQTSTAQTPEHNGIVERRNRTLVEAARTMLSAAKVPLFFWAEAIATNLIPDPQSRENVPHTAEIVTTSNDLDLLFSLMFNELLNGTTPVVSKSSAVTTTDAPNQCQQQNTTPSTSTTVAADIPPLNFQTTPETTNQAPTVTATENIIQAETNKEYAQVDEDEFINIFSTPVQERGETSSRYADSSNMQTFYQQHPSEHRWTKDHMLEQVIRNPSQSITTRRQLETNGEMCMFALTVSRTKPKNIKEAMADSALIEAMQEELHQFDRLDV